jgi:predicted nucleic acid-binding protein
MIETDLLYAFVKKDNWLKAIADKIIKRIVDGEFGIVYTSRECLHELYYISKEEGISLDDYISRAAAITAIENLKFLETTYEIDLLALTLMRQYNIKSIFDAYYAATALNQVKDHMIISADDIYDMIPGLTRIDPRKL